MSDLLSRIARERELEKIRGKKLSSGSREAELVEQLPLRELLQLELNKLRRLMPSKVANDADQVQEWLGGPEFSDVFVPGSPARAKALKIFDYFLGVADAHNLTVIELLDEYKINYRARIDAAKVAATPASTNKATPVSRYNVVMLAVLKNEHEQPSRFGAHFGSKKDKIALRDLVKRGLAKITHEEKKGPEGPQLYGRITDAGLEAYRTGFYPDAAARQAVPTLKDGQSLIFATRDLGNNESSSIGISRNGDTYIAVTHGQSKSGFKTIPGAKKWLEQKLGKPLGKGTLR